MRKTRVVVIVLLALFATCFPVVHGNAARSSAAGKLIFEGWGAPEQYGVASAYDIWIVNEDGTGLKNLSEAPGYEGNAAWSPDRRTIAFDSDRFGKTDIFVMSSDGTRRKRLTASPAPEQWATWSPDGRMIAYGKGSQLWVMRKDGSGKRKIYSSRGETVMPTDWAPNGRWIAFTVGNHPANTDWDIHVIHPDGSGFKDLIATEEDESYLRWAPDGRSVVFSRYYRDTCKTWWCNWDVFTAGSDGRDEKNITSTPFNAEYEADWSSDGTRLAYVDEYGTAGWDSDIFLMNADGTDRHHLVPRPDSLDYSVDW